MVQPLLTMEQLSVKHNLAEENPCMQANRTLDPLAIGEGRKKAETKRKIQEILQEPVESKRKQMGGGSGVSTTDNPLLELPMDLHRYNNILKLMWKTLHLLYSFLWFLSAAHQWNACTRSF